MSGYAAAIAPVIDAAHVNLHAAAHREVTALAEAAGISPGYLSDLRFTLPLRPLTRARLEAIYRYRSAAEREGGVRQHLCEGTLAEDAGLLRATAKGLAFIRRLYKAHADAAERVWAGHDLAGLAGLAARVLERAERGPGGALAALAPPYEPEGTPPGVLLFNRLAVLRYQRADAHAAAWQAAGLSAAGIVALAAGPQRDRIETDTNERAAPPYGALTADERETLYDGLRALM
ncbi:MAG TPA: hypothetical protein VFV66_35525 [Nonomuraea sp.]|nr:hypothetical protein [Nonomuraea sp.]